MTTHAKSPVSRRLTAIFVFAAAACLCSTDSPAREDVDLNGEWEYQEVTELTYPPPSAWQPTTVPGYLSGYNYEKAWFRTTFTLPASMSGMKIKLLFGGVKYDSKVYVNGQFLGGHLNGYNPFELDIANAVQFGVENELLVGLSDWTALFTSPVDFSNLQPGESPRDRAKNVIIAPIGGRYELYGIWQGVTLRSVPGFSAEDVFVVPSVREGKLTVRATVRNEDTIERTGTLRNQVLDGQQIVLTLPDAEITLAPGESAVKEVGASWPDARPWSLSDPHLYHLDTTLEPPSGLADEVVTRFGFREFWREGDSFYLNGTRINLLATSCWPPNNLMNAEDIRKVLEDVKASNNVAYRLHTQPWDETWYEVADEVGLLIVEEGAVWCDPAAYRLADPTFWANFGDHLTAAVKRDRNHPSLVMWSLENELLHCGGGNIYAGTEAELAKLGRLVKELDPTRPITYEADLDPGGEADVIGLHYPHEFPNYHLWPNTAYWMDEPIPIGFAPGGTWQWDRQKPLYIGEFLWVPASSPDGFTILYGDEPYADATYYRSQAKGWTWRMQIEAYRGYGVNGMCPWTMFEDIATRWDALDLNTDENHLYQVQKEAYHPNAVFVKQYDSRFFIGETVERSLCIYNDTMRHGHYTLRWSVGGESSTRSFPMEPAERRRETITFQTPSTPRDFCLTIELLDGETTVFSDEKMYAACAAPLLTLAEGTRLGVFDTEGSTAALLTQQGVPYTPISDLAAAPYDQLDVLIVGKNSLGEEQALQVGAESIGARWEAFAESGGWVIVLEQSSYPRWMPLSLSATDYRANFAFPRAADHSIVSGMSAEDLRWWRGDNFVTAGSLSKPSRGNFRVLVDVGSQNGLDHAAMVEIPRGKGGFIFSQMLLVTKFSSEPMAGILLQRILDYCSHQSNHLRYAGLVAEPDSDAAKALSQLGLLHENLSGRLATQNVVIYPLLLIAGGDSAWNEAQASLGKLASYVEQGGKLLLHRPSDAFLSAAASTLFPDLEAASNVSVPILKGAQTEEVSALTNYDLYWIDQPGSWNREATLSENIADRVYRKRFTLTHYEVIEVENMPVKTGGGAVAGGWNMYVNGYVAQNITVAKGGDYLFGVIARGTQAYGEYPRMVLRIDGKFEDALVVKSETWQLHSLGANLSAGQHEMALAFTNDAWDPPDDRNLYMDHVRYGLDPSPQDEVFLTRPGAIVQANRGSGLILLDEIAWETEQKNRGKAERIISTLLTELGATIRTPSGLRIEAEEMEPKGFGYFRVYDGIAFCGSNGRLEASVRFTSSGDYSFEVTGYGTPALGVYPLLELRIDGVKQDEETVDSQSLSRFLLSATVTKGEHVVALAFVNDYYEPPEDRNLALDRLIVSEIQNATPRVLDLLLGKGNKTVTLVWEVEQGNSYEVEFAADFSGRRWLPAANLLANGNVVSWTDDGTTTGISPGDPSVTRRFYRIFAAAGD